MGDVNAAQWLRSARWARRISQRELAELAGLPRSTVDRIEAERTVPRFDTFAALLDAVGYEIAVVDRHGRQLGRGRGQGPPSYIDRGGRQFPAHLRAQKVPPYLTRVRDGYWWGYDRIAWSEKDPVVPEYTYEHRWEPPTFTGRDAADLREQGRVWDDAT